MTEEEKLAEEWLDDERKYIIEDVEGNLINITKKIKEAFFAGLKAKTQWHRLADAEMPEQHKIVLCVIANGWVEDKPRYIYKLLTRSDFAFTHGIIAWTEIPLFNEGRKDDRS